MKLLLKNSNTFTPSKAFISNEKGSAGLWALVGLSVLIGYIKYLRPELLGKVHPLLDSTLLVALTMVTIFALGCALHMKSIGDRPSGRLRKDIIKQIRDLHSTVSFANKRIFDVEQLLAQTPGSLTPRGLDRLGDVRKLVRAMERRLSEAAILIRNKDHASLVDAFDILSKQLAVVENPLESLIDSNPMPPIEVWEWAPTVQKLVVELEGEVRKAA
jgi:hypothetical protein